MGAEIIGNLGLTSEFPFQRGHHLDNGIICQKYVTKAPSLTKLRRQDKKKYAWVLCER